MNRKAIATVAVLAAAFFGAACSSSGGKAAATLEVAGPTPSASATMVCAAEAQSDIASSIGLDAVRVSKPTWDEPQHLLSCNYDYPARAVMTLTVKELSSPAETAAYFDLLGRNLGRTRTVKIGQGAYQTTNGSVVVRKDYKVLLIDVTHLPAQFGAPRTSRADIATNVAVVIMQCWAGG